MLPLRSAYTVSDPKWIILGGKMFIGLICGFQKTLWSKPQESGSTVPFTHNSGCWWCNAVTEILLAPNTAYLL